MPGIFYGPFIVISIVLLHHIVIGKIERNERNR